MKGNIDVSVQAIVFGVITVLLAAGLLHLGLEGQKYLKSITLDLEADRVVNAGLALESIPEGYVKLNIPGYTFNYDQGDLNLSVLGESAVRDVESNTSYDRIVYSGSGQDTC
ncbi:MAG: hypothetical protein SVV03_03930 [Candidatus Nanohaloarchaea archaeon]|nr:hypothetical protein [Candidatus Nanohaloarchaea archaeon]